MREFRVESECLSGEALEYAMCGGCARRREDGVAFARVTFWAGNAGQGFVWCEFCLGAVLEGLRSTKETVR